MFVELQGHDVMSWCDARPLLPSRSVAMSFDRDPRRRYTRRCATVLCACMYVYARVHYMYICIIFRSYVCVCTYALYSGPNVVLTPFAALRALGRKVAPLRPRGRRLRLPLPAPVAVRADPHLTWQAGATRCECSSRCPRRQKRRHPTRHPGRKAVRPCV